MVRWSWHMPYEFTNSTAYDLIPLYNTVGQYNCKSMKKSNGPWKYILCNLGLIVISKSIHDALAKSKVTNTRKVGLVRYVRKVRSYNSRKKPSVYGRNWHKRVSRSIVLPITNVVCGSHIVEGSRPRSLPGGLVV